MTVLEKFVAFTEALPADRRAEIEEMLAELMDTDSGGCDFTAEEIAELDRRCADESEKWIDEETFRAKLRALQA